MIPGRVTQPCLGGCEHTDAQHFAFDEGVEHGELGVKSERYQGTELREDYELGVLVGSVNRFSKEAA